MANFLSLYTSRSRLLLLLQLLFLISGELILQSDGAPINDVCRQTTEPPLCLSVLGTDPRSGDAALPDLAQIAIDIAGYNASNTRIKIHERLVFSTNPQLKSLYADCDNLYLDALDALRAAPGELQGRQYGDLGVTAARVIEAVEKCEADFKGGSPFRMENEALVVVAQAIEVMARNLSG